MRESLRVWETSRQDGRRVWLDDRVIRCAGGVLAVWNPNRETLQPCPEPGTGVQPAALAAFLAQAAPRSALEAAAFLDAHLDRLVSMRDSGAAG